MIRSPEVAAGMNELYQRIQLDGEVTMGIITAETVCLINSITLFDLLDYPKLDIGSELALDYMEDSKRTKDLLKIVKQQAEKETAMLLVVFIYFYHVIRFTPESSMSHLLDERKLRMYIATLLKVNAGMTSWEYSG